jgi:DNA-binding CsgD family transcriptional regulator
MVIIYTMKRPIFVRPLSGAEHNSLEAGLRSPDALTLRRCQILLKSADGQSAYQIARNLGCNPQTVRNAIHIFNQEGLSEALKRGSNRPHTVHRAFDPEGAQALRQMLHRSRPREFGKDSSLWTMEMAAEVSFEEGLTKGRISGESVPATLWRMGGRLAKGQTLDQLCPSSLRKKEAARS